MSERITSEEIAELRRLCESASHDSYREGSDLGWAELGPEVPRLLDEIDWQRAEIDRLRGLLSGDAEVRHMTFSPEKGCEVEVEHWAVKIIAESLFKSLGGAPNFVAMTVTHADHGPVEVTIRRPEGKPTAAVLAELRAEVDRLRAEATKPVDLDELEWVGFADGRDVYSFRQAKGENG